MKKYLKKISAVLMAAIMMLAMCTVGVFADQTYPKPTDTNTITVNNVEEGATVKAYHIVKAQYVDGIGFEKYAAIDGTNIQDPVAPTAAEIQDIAARISNGTFTSDEFNTTELTYNAETGSYTADVTAGYWLILVTGGDASKVYNPMIAGVYYSVSGSDNTMASDPIDASKKWELLPGTAYDKSVDVSVDKTIIGGTGKTTTGSDSTKGDDVAIGDYINYSIEGTIPSYTTAYKKAVYKITDKTSDGLKIQASSDDYPIIVKVGNQVVSATEVKEEGTVTNYTVTVEDHQMIIDFNSDFVLAHTGQSVVVTYYAQLTDDAVTNFDANTNTVKITYTNGPTINEDGTTPTTDTPEDKTYHYTFEIDGSLYGEGTIEGDKITTELTKTGTKSTATKYTDTEYGPLSEAEFSLTMLDSEGNKTDKVYTSKSDSKGQLNFKGLDAGKYVLKETKAPAPYSLNAAEIPVEITASYNEDGTLANYNVIIGESGNSKTFTYTATYTKTGITKIESNQADGSTYEFKNTPISELPSTGGIGTYIFTIAGIAIMAIAAGLIVVSRKRRNS